MLTMSQEEETQAIILGDKVYTHATIVDKTCTQCHAAFPYDGAADALLRQSKKVLYAWELLYKYGSDFSKSINCNFWRFW